jgi:hypothetical protein
MNRTVPIIIIIVATAITCTFSASGDNRYEIRNAEKLEGITHYGMPIEEITKKYRNDNAVLEIVYSKMLSDDNMDDYVKRFYDELLSQIEKWLYEKKLPVANMKIVISNCKFCKVGYCKKKNLKEIKLVSYRDEKKKTQIALNHIDIMDRKKYVDIARSVVIKFLENDK